MLTFNDIAPEVFVSLNMTVFLSGATFATAGAALLLFLLNIPFPSLKPFYRTAFRLSALDQNKVQDDLTWSQFNNILIYRTGSMTLPFLLQWIYVVVTVEQIIQRNPVIHNGPRFPITFGQVRCSLHVDNYGC